MINVYTWLSVANFLVCWGMMVLIGKPLILWLKGLKGMKWSPREDTPDSHLAKAGTPSMGGIGIIGCALTGYLGIVILLLLYLIWNRPAVLSELRSGLTLLAIHALLFPAMVAAHAGLGLMDDWSKATGRGGLSSKAKLLGQIILAASFLAVVYAGRSGQDFYIATLEKITSAGPLSLALMFLFLGLLIVGTSNAVNLTDGIDGLAAGLSVQCGLVFTLLIGNSFASNGGTAFWAALGGACLGFLAYNKYKAQVFMGDTGSLALGAALGAGAILSGAIALLPFIGFIFYVEMFSVIFQVAWFKFTRRKYGEGRRLLRRAPLHHHFELGGWSETRVVVTFWAINAGTTLLGLLLWYGGVLPRF